VIDFSREETDLVAAVGLTTEAILAEVSPALPGQLALARAAFDALAPRGDLDQAERLRRDRLDSLLQELYGHSGLLARAGALVALRDRLHRIAALAPRCMSAPDASAKLRRDSLVARTFAREQVARGQSDGHQRLANAVAQVSDAAATLDDFCAEIRAATGQHSMMWRALGLGATADAAEALPKPKTVAEGVAFVLRRLADASYVTAASGQLDRLCAVHSARIRDALWDAAESGYARRDAAAGIAELAELDSVLEELRAKLVDPRLDSKERAAGIAQLYALVTSSRAVQAASAADAALAPLEDLLAQGIRAEV
jgi:hypothetical protein